MEPRRKKKTSLILKSSNCSQNKDGFVCLFVVVASARSSILDLECQVQRSSREKKKKKKNWRWQAVSTSI
jgi:hypothetical protein